MTSTEWNPGKLLSTSGSYWMSAAIHAAVALDLFTTIGEQKRSAEEIAEEHSASPRGVSAILNALAAMGLITKEDRKFLNTSFSKTFLSKDSPEYMGYIIDHHHNLFASWGKLDQAVKTGTPTRARASHGDEKERQDFLRGMFNQGMRLAPQMARILDLSGVHRLLDLGGGPGTYGIHFCLANPRLHATILDLPTSEHLAKQTIDRFHLSDRVSFIAGDFLEDKIEGSYDVAFLSHILHGEGPENSQQIVNKAASCLTPDGRIIIHEFILNDSEDGPLFPALFSLNMLVGTPRGQSYSERTLTEMLQGAGLIDIHRIPFKSPNDSGLLQGRRPS